MMEPLRNYRVIWYQKPWPPLESHFNEHFLLTSYQEGTLPPSQEIADWVWFFSRDLSKFSKETYYVFSHKFPFTLLSQPATLSSYMKKTHLISFPLSIKMTSHPWQCMKLTSFLLGLYCGKQSSFALGGNLGSDCVAVNPFKHGGQDNVDGTAPVA